MSPLLIFKQKRGGKARRRSDWGAAEKSGEHHEAGQVRKNAKQKTDDKSQNEIWKP